MGTCLVRNSTIRCCFRRSYSFTNAEAIPSHAKVVICGGGVQGAALGYFLAQHGWGQDTLILDQGKIGRATPWHMSGLIGIFKPTSTETRITEESIKLYDELARMGYDTGFKQCGSLLLARTRDRMTHFRRMKSHAVCRKIECYLLTNEEIAKRYPYINTQDLQGGLWIPIDAVADPHKICESLAALAAAKGVRMFEHIQVNRVLTSQNKVAAVETDRGTIKCDFFVNCAGFWARSLGKKTEPLVKVPVQAVEHYYLHTKPVKDIDENMPVVRDLDGHVYFRVQNGCVLAGGFEPLAKPVFEDGALPLSVEDSRLEVDWDHFAPMLEQMVQRVPLMRNAVLDKLCNGPESFSPDCKWVLGEASEVDNYFVATGMKSLGIASAGGVAKHLSEWIVTGKPPYPLNELNVQRFVPLHNNRQFLLERMREVPGVHYQLPYPFSEFRTGRRLRVSPVFPRLKAAGAVFGQTMGYERPAYYEPKPYQDSDIEDLTSRSTGGTSQNVEAPFRVAYTNTFMKPHWFESVRNEYRACRESVAIADYSSFTKLDLTSPGSEVVDFLQYVCSNDVDVPIGAILHTGMHNENGGYESDCSLARLSDNHYMMIAPIIQQTRCQAWLRRQQQKFAGGNNASVNISDVTSLYTALCVMGPLSRAVLSELTEADLSPKSFPFFTVKEMDMGSASGIRAMNLTHTGEMGWVLYIPNEAALHVYDKIMEHGRKYAIHHAGYLATRSLRVERFYAYWGQDIDASTTPLECGRGFRVKLNSDINFIGREALLKQKKEGVQRMYVQFQLDDHDPEIDPWPWGSEPIYRNGEFAGMVTTAGFGFTLNRQVCLGYVQNYDVTGTVHRLTPDYVTSGQYEVDIAGLRYNARVSLRSPTLPTKFRETYGDHYVATRHGGGA
ncbi:pyruvate dehydrogenase phosphatase regulatory subunit, mitochondrial-like [Daphnia pulicaria]|uniref:pyruvate dehydrogenase phosphatase regulatory subunit, mitochondrial-like n=1 Tax=Daphnia pulicaria TaxID=35523 RepID=UPI001EEC7D41|nr:pyruvate dehydrogenase phosphatase regulatory subunit, mitochondrial-like [Daphnia pulicaria]